VNAPDPILTKEPPLQVDFLSLTQVRLSKLALLLGDALALALAFGLSTLLVVAWQGADWSVWWQGQDPQRFMAWGASRLQALCCC